MNRPEIPSTAACALMALGCLAVSPAHAEMGMGKEPLLTYFSADRLEAQFRDGDDARLWDVDAWVGKAR